MTSTWEVLYRDSRAPTGGGKEKGGFYTFAAVTTAGVVDAQGADTRKELLKSREGNKRLKVEDLKKVGSCPACLDKEKTETIHFYTRRFHL